MRVRSPAKVNLQLRIGPRLKDGFHPLVSWMTTVGLFDTLDLSLDLSADWSRASAGQVMLTCSDPSLPTDGRNLVVKAAEMLLSEEESSTGESTARGRLPGVRIHLNKYIPAGGGLGGGSGNAATTLVALNTLWQLDFSIDRLSTIAGKLGSDVAFFLKPPSAICTGRGEIVRPIDPPTGAASQGLWIVLIFPALAMPTPAVYRQLDLMRPDNDAGDWEATEDWAAWKNLQARELLARLRNDLEAPAFVLRPDLSQLRQRIETGIGRTVRMSGSGSTLFTLFDEQELAELTANTIQNDFSVRTVNVPLVAQV